ncbi:Protein CBG05769 [Caenorhabditis briggsae]|uniref:Protein CBG05769 n=1 Tax=Caenorhabditis briggsae TaxID=6238 RepID=A8X1P0_CAEBR|nr:Protein CBG05769 [Caenorhabditis briggsae]CAP26550.2 Protein CBG05769 [Caenorhabditis briggsae]
MALRAIMKEVSAKKLSVKKRKLKNIKYYPKELVAFLTDVIEVFRAEKTLCHISPPVTIVGDLNGHLQDLVRIFNIKNEKALKEEDGKQVFATEKFVFLGDLTGENQKYNLETVCLLFGLKMLYCNRYILLRGYEETRSNTEFRNQIMSKFPGAAGEDIWSKFKTAFSLLPAAAIVGEKILCVHSGISPLVKRSIGELKEIPKRDTFENLAPIVRDVIFARPCEPEEDGADSEDPLYIFHEPTNTRKFNDAAIKHFCEKEKIDLVVRSHAVLSNGFRFSADKKLITIFSSPSYKDMPMLHPERLNDDQKVVNCASLIENHFQKDIAWYEVDQLCNEVIVNLMNEQNLVSVSVPVTIVGDIHGNFHDLYRALLARTNPDMIEERTSVKTSLEELTPFYANKLQKKFEEVFSWMPLAAVVGEKIFCVHGGISPHLDSLKDIDKIPRPLLDVKENILATDLIYSDPLDYEFLHVPKMLELFRCPFDTGLIYREPIFEANYLRHAGVLFNEATVEEFCERTGMKLIVRSHTMIPFGYRLFANRKMITIFTSTGYKKERNHGSVMKEFGTSNIKLE